MDKKKQVYRSNDQNLPSGIRENIGYGFKITITESKPIRGIFRHWFSAIELKIGTCIYFEHNYVHRDDGPAIYHEESGEKWWVKNGMIHREDGPAIIICGEVYWYYEGYKMKFSEWAKLVDKENVCNPETLVELKLRYG